MRYNYCEACGDPGNRQTHSMTRITLSESIKTQLGDLSKPLALYDENGAPLGTFTPTSKLTEQQRIAMTLPEHLLDSPVSVEELDRRLREEPLIPHEEVMAEVMELVRRLS
jgi:hypothetical protein